MTETIRTAVIRPISGRSGAFELVLDGTVFPWRITREAVVVEKPYGISDPWSVLRLGLVVSGPVEGAREFNEYLAEKADMARVRQADRRDLMDDLGLSYSLWW